VNRNNRTILAHPTLFNSALQVSLQKKMQFFYLDQSKIGRKNGISVKHGKNSTIRYYVLSFSVIFPLHWFIHFRCPPLIGSKENSSECTCSMKLSDLIFRIIGGLFWYIFILPKFRSYGELTKRFCVTICKQSYRSRKNPVFLIS